MVVRNGAHQNVIVLPNMATQSYMFAWNQGYDFFIQGQFGKHLHNKYQLLALLFWVHLPTIVSIVCNVVTVSQVPLMFMIFTFHLLPSSLLYSGPICNNRQFLKSHLCS